MNEARGTGSPGCLEECLRPVHVHAEIRFSSPGRLEAGRRVDHGIERGHPQRFKRLEIARERRCAEAADPFAGRSGTRERQYVVPIRHERRDRASTEEPGAAGDEDSHASFCRLGLQMLAMARSRMISKSRQKPSIGMAPSSSGTRQTDATRR